MIHLPPQYRGPGVSAILEEVRPSAVINCAALSSTARCRSDPRAALEANALWPSVLARACAARGTRLVHVSTDLVYSGGNAPYTLQSPAVPLSIYGWTKLFGDMLVLRRSPGALVLRTSVLVGAVGAAAPTFTEELLAGLVPGVYVDAIRSFTPIDGFAEDLLELSEGGAEGLRIVCSRQAYTRAAFAEMFLRGRGIETLPPQTYRPAGTPADLSMIPSEEVRAFRFGPGD